MSKTKHTCLNGITATCCGGCAGHPPKNRKPCQKCNGRGFVMAKCGPCSKDKVTEAAGAPDEDDKDEDGEYLLSQSAK